MSSTEMKSYLSLIPISAKVRRRQNRMTILCIVLAVFLRRQKASQNYKQD